VVPTRTIQRFDAPEWVRVRPLRLEGAQRGVGLLAMDSVGAGVGETVLVVVEGKAAGEALGRKGAPVDAAIIGIIDAVTVTA